LLLWVGKTTIRWRLIKLIVGLLICLVLQSIVLWNIRPPHTTIVSQGRVIRIIKMITNRSKVNCGHMLKRRLKRLSNNMTISGLM
jgi:hypothetical protein